MHTLFVRLPVEKREAYVQTKLRRLAVDAKRSGNADVQRSFSETTQRAANSLTVAPPLVPASDLPTPNAAQRRVIDERIRCALETLEQDSPLAKGESVKDDLFTFLNAPFMGFLAGTPVLRRRTNLGEMLYVFDELRITKNADVKTVPPPAFVPSDVPAPPLIRSRKIDTTALAKDLASGLASGIGGKIGAIIFDYLFPPGVPDYFNEVYEEIGRIVGKELSQNTVDAINGELNGTVRWLRQTYANLRRAESPPPNAELFKMLEPYVVSLNTRVIGPLMEKRYEEAGFSVFMIAAPVHMGLLQEQALIDPNQSVPLKSGYAKALQGYAKTYADHAERVLKQLVKARRALVTTVPNPTWIQDTSAAGGFSKPAYRWKDNLTGDFGRTYEQYTDDDKKVHNGDEEANRDRDIRRASVEQSLRSSLGTPTNAIRLWRKLINNPIPKV